MKVGLPAATGVALMAAVTAMTITAAPAHAQTTVENCPPGTVNWTFSPPLTDTVQTTTASVSYVYPLCAGLDLTITSATINRTGALPLSCSTSTLAFRTETVKWNNGNDSVLQLNNFADVNMGTLRVFGENGTVTSGEFAGATVFESSSYLLSLFQGCSDSNPMASLSGNSALAIQSAL